MKINIRLLKQNLAGRILHENKINFVMREEEASHSCFTKVLVWFHRLLRAFILQPKL